MSADEIEKTPEVQTSAEKGSDNVEGLNSQTLMTPENFAALDNSRPVDENISKQGFPGSENFGSQSTDWATKSGKQSLKNDAKQFANSFADTQNAMRKHFSGLA